MPQTLSKVPKVHLISWCENFVETEFFQNFHTRKLGENLVFYAAKMLSRIESGGKITERNFVTAFILFHSMKIDRLM